MKHENRNILSHDNISYDGNDDHKKSVINLRMAIITHRPVWKGSQIVYNTLLTVARLRRFVDTSTVLFSAASIC